MNYKTMRGVYVLLAIAGIALAVFLSRGKEDAALTADALLDDELLVTAFTNNGEQTGMVLLQVPFVRTVEEQRAISIHVDRNGDRNFADDEKLVSELPVRPQVNWRSGYYARVETPLEEGLLARVTVNGAEYDIPVTLKAFEAGDLHGLESITDPENAMKGFGESLGIWTAHAQSEPVEVTQDGVPDLTQRIGECAPTSAANSLISLVDKNGGEDLIPGDPQDFIENLKRHMNWTPENGVLPDDFVDGKNRWAAAAGVPIRTTKVGDANGISTIDAIREALENGDAVELRIKFGDGSGKAVGGHMVTVVGIHQGDGQTYLDINDPKTPDSGTETVEVRGNQIVNYGLWEGITVLSWGFVQTWEVHPTGELFDTMTDEEIQGIREFVGEQPTIMVIEYGGKHLPVSELIVENEKGCGAEHWHASRGSVTATDGTVVPDPGPQCGYGKVSERPSFEIEASRGDGEGSMEVRGLESLETR